MRRHLTSALIAAAFACATATAASADPLSALFGSLFGDQRSEQFGTRSYEPAATS
jgi:hypothetical protein